MLRRYVHLVPAMVADCLAQQGVQAEKWELVVKPIGWAVREHLSDEHVDQFKRAHELRQALVEEAQRAHRSPGEMSRAREPRRTNPRDPPTYVLLDLLESSFEHQKGLAALERVLDALARIPGLQIRGRRKDLLRFLSWAIGESAARRPTETAEPGPVPGSPDGGPAPSGAPAELGRPRAPAGAPVSDDGFELD